MKKKCLFTLTAILIPFISAQAAPTGQPAITFHSSAYGVVGEANSNTFLIGTSETTKLTIVDGYGEREATFEDVQIEDGEFIGNYESVKVPADGLIKIYGDASKINFIQAEGAYITKIEMPECKNLWYLDLSHNALEELDLTGFSKLQAIYLTDNPFTEATPLKIGPDKPELAILEIDIVDWLDQSFNLSDYPKLQAFDGYHNMTLYNVDPTGCPELLVLSVEMCPVSSIDVSKNQKLLRLNISESRITEIDLSQNASLEHFLAGHVSGTINLDYYLHNVDLTHNPSLYMLDLSGNRLTDIDLSGNPKLAYLKLSYNNLTSLDVSAQEDALVSMYLRDNNMDYATLPWPNPEYYEYFYRQNAMAVPRSMKVGSVLDLSSRVLREGTVTTASVYRHVYDGDDVLLDPSLYSYADGKITFTQALPDSVYVEYANDIFTDYKATTQHFMVKSDEEFGKPSPIVVLKATGNHIAFHACMMGATPESPKNFQVDFGDGVRRDFTTTASLDYSAEGTLVEGDCTGYVTIYIPEGEVLTALDLSGNPLAELDITGATELERLNVNGCKLASLDLTYNRCLQELLMAKNNLSMLDLTGVYGDYEKNVLHTLDASDNKLVSFKAVATYVMNHLNLSGNQLTEIDLENYDNLLTLDLSGNQLAEINLNHLLSAKSVDLSDNLLTFVNPCETYLVEGVNLKGNLLDYSTLPAPSTFGPGYVYAPQAKLQIPTKASTVNLENYSATVEGNPTTYVWKKLDGTTLTEGTDYRMEDGVAYFIDKTVGTVYCEMQNATFPQLSGADVLRTTDVEVIDMPNCVVAKFTTLSKNGSNPVIILAASEPVQVYIDWTGQDTDLYPYPVEQQYQQFAVEEITNNAKVTIYADTPDVAGKISMFSLYNIKLDAVDLSRLTGTISINLGNTKLTEEQLTMPDAPEMNDMNFEGNQFTTFPYCEKYPKLTMLNLSNNGLKDFDFSSVKNVGYLVMSKNKLKNIGSFNNPKLWSLMVDNNEIESCNLVGMPAIEQLLLQNNKLSTIDISMLTNCLRAINLNSNCFTFATLPVPDANPNLNVYYYSGQAKLAVTADDGKVDLSAQAVIDATPTEFTWFVGTPTYDEENYVYTGEQLEAGSDYEITNGVTRFLKEPAGKVSCMLTNEVFPNLILFTDLVEVKMSGVEGITTEESETEIYNLQGVRVSSDFSKLPAGIYIVNGKKVIK